jgi:predicted KAP-like P-loop ATPase
MREDQRLGPALAIVKAVFPKVAAAFGGPSPAIGMEDIWRRDLRAASPDALPTYFRFGVSSGQVSGIELATFLRQASSAEAVSDRLMQLKNAGNPQKAREFIDRIVDYSGSDEIGPEEQNGLLGALFMVGDELLGMSPESLGVFEFGIDVSIGRLIRRLLEPMPEERRYQTLRTALEGGQALSLLVRELSVFGPEERAAGREPFLTDDHLKELRSIALERIRERAANGSLVDAPELPSILYRWREWKDDEEPRQWASSVVADEGVLARILKAFLSEIRVESVGASGETVRTSRYVLDPRSLEPFIDPDSIIEATKHLLETTTDARTRLAAESFIRDHELRERGIDPRDAD